MKIEGEDMGLTEAEIIELIREMVGEPSTGVRVPIGDDAALFDFAGRPVLLTVDSIYEGVHFRLDTFGLSDVGWKALAAGVSDIAAMGGEPACALLSLGFGKAPEAQEVRSLVGGVLEMASACNCALIGGDVCRSSCGLAVTVTVAGVLPSGPDPVLRSGAAVGDIIGVTGTLGDSAAGLFILERGDEHLRSSFPRLVEDHLRPRPQVRAGILLAEAGVSSMEDVSDGLAADLGHICEMSGVGCTVDSAMLPLSDELLRLAAGTGSDPLAWALGGGEDYELVFTAPPDAFASAERALAEHEIPVSHIGSIRTAGEGRTISTPAGTNELKGQGFDHFAGR